MWLMRDYLPETADLDARTFPDIDRLVGLLGGDGDIEVVPTSRETPDWTLASYWAHPERVLDEDARRATSGIARLEPHVVERAVDALRRDLEDGTWDAHNGHLRTLRHLDDVGMRLVVARP